MTPFYPGCRAVMLSLGLLTFAGALPAQWDAARGRERPPADSRWPRAARGSHPRG